MKKLNSKQLKSIITVRDFIKKSDIGSIVDMIYLYGSCARGEQSFDSDVDIFVVIDNIKITDDIREQFRKLIVYGHTLPDDYAEADIHFSVGSEWEHDNTIYHNSIKNEGILLWKR